MPNIPPSLPERPRPTVPGGKPDLSGRGLYHNTDDSLLWKVLPSEHTYFFAEDDYANSIRCYVYVHDTFTTWVFVTWNYMFYIYDFYTSAWNAYQCLLK